MMAVHGSRAYCVKAVLAALADGKPKSARYNQCYRHRRKDNIASAVKPVEKTPHSKKTSRCLSTASSSKAELDSRATPGCTICGFV